MVVRTVSAVPPINADLLGSVPTMENPQILSPEVLWGQNNLIDFESPIVSESTSENDSEASLGLSALDPLKATKYCQCSISPNLPMLSSTPYPINEPDDFSLDVTGSTFEFYQ